jgi:type I restriction enzyme, S subunit
LSNLPKGWAHARIPDLITPSGVFSDGDWIESKDQDPDGSVRLIQLADIGDGSFIDKSNRFLTKSKAAKLGCTFLRKGDLLIARMPDPLGRACIFPGDSKDAVTVVDVCVIRGNDDHFQQRWLMYFVNAPKFREAINALQSGSTRKRISRGNLSTLEIPIPPRTEQTRIVAKLEELLSELDAGVAELKAAQKKLIQYRQSLLKAAVEGALTAEWRKSNPPTEIGAQLLERILIERRARWEAKQLAKFKEQGKAPPKDWQSKYPEPVKPDLTGLPELPEGWVWVSAEQICEFITKGTTPSKNPNVNSENGIPFLRVTNLTDTGEIDLRDRVFVSVETHSGFLARSKVFTDDILMNIVGPPLGQVSHVSASLGECNVNQAIAIFRCIHGALPKYMLNALLSPTLQRWLAVRAKTTAGQTNLTLEVCRSLPVPLAPQREQNEIVSQLAELLSELKRQGSSLVKMLNNSKAQRANILKSAFSGKLVPQDSNDEQASTLLAKISANRSEAMANTQRRKVTKATAPVV